MLIIRSGRPAGEVRWRAWVRGEGAVDEMLIIAEVAHGYGGGSEGAHGIIRI